MSKENANKCSSCVLTQTTTVYMLEHFSKCTIFNILATKTLLLPAIA